MSLKAKQRNSSRRGVLEQFSLSERYCEADKHEDQAGPLELGCMEILTSSEALQIPAEVGDQVQTAKDEA